MKVGSLFTGIGGFDLGFDRAGWQTLWQVEREPFCNEVLARHWPAVQRFPDVCAVGSRNLAPVDCITAGVPCQDVSIAGKRAGLAGARGSRFPLLPEGKDAARYRALGNAFPPVEAEWIARRILKYGLNAS